MKKNVIIFDKQDITCVGIETLIRRNRRPVQIYYVDRKDDLVAHLVACEDSFVVLDYTDNTKKHRNKPNRLSDSEVMTILIAFHLSGMRNLKAYYVHYVNRHLTNEFPKLVSYTRFVELQQRALLPLVLFLKTCRMGKCTGISFIDSTTYMLAPCTRKKHLFINSLAVSKKECNFEPEKQNRH